MAFYQQKNLRKRSKLLQHIIHDRKIGKNSAHV